MRSIGLFEAKTKLSQICREVASSGQAVVVNHRGKPMVRIEAVSRPKGASVWERRATLIKKSGLLTEEFDLPKRDKQMWRDPLE